MTKRECFALVCVVSATRLVGLIQFKEQSDERVKSKVLRIVKLKRFGLRIDTRVVEYLDETAPGVEHRWIVGTKGWFGRTVPVRLEISPAKSPKHYDFSVDPDDKSVQPLNDQTGTFVKALSHWARAKTPKFLRTPKE